MKTMDSQDILNLKFYSEDLSKELTIKQFFIALLATLWREGESFSGKRPFGNSGWQGDLIECLVKNELIEGEIDADGYLGKVDWSKADEFVEKNILPFL